MDSTTALVVIDAQESFRRRPYFTDDDLPTFFGRTRILIDGFQRRALPVVRVLHVEDSGAFSHAGGLVKPMPELDFEPAAIFEKHAHSALMGTGLQTWLIQHAIQRLVICGIRTEQCCETTTRHASDAGFSVDYVTEATLTFAMTNALGRTFTAAEIKERTELVLEGRFAHICLAEEALERAF